MALNSRSIHFSIARPKDILKQSVVEITSTTLYKPKQRIPCEAGVLSLLMGTLDRRLRCVTCGHDTLQCPGHFGHITFAAPIYHVGFIKPLVKMLRNFCYWCARTLRCSAQVRRIATNALRQRRASAASTLSVDTTSTAEKSSIRCVYCQGVIPFYKCDGHKINISWPENKTVDKKTRTLPATKALSLLERASLLEQNGDLQSIKRLKNAILTVLIVPPPCIRPSVIHEFGGKNRGQDDLTRSLNSIVLCNNKLQEQIQDPENIFGKPDKALLAELQWTVSSYMNNDVRGERKATTRIGGSSRDLRSRLVGKHGRVRNTLMGKRVNYSARDVITPDVFIKIDQVGVPLCIAETLLKPVLVNLLNVDRLTEQLHQGIIKFVTVLEKKELPRRVLIDPAMPKNFPLPLQVGWTVERTMMDDDYVCMNRHPSLHRVSMMGHRAKILPPDQLTFRMNPAICPPYNADFDGDEMNLHLPTVQEAAAELQELMAVPKHIISPQNSRLTIGAVQDCALGLYLITEPVSLSREDFFQLICLCDCPFDAEALPNKFDGHRLVSVFLPKHFSQKGSDFEIQDGVMLRGRLSRSIIHLVLAAVVLDFGQEVALELLSRWQLLACSYLSLRGFSIGLDDCTLDDDSSEAIASFIDSSLAKVSQSPVSGEVKAQALSSLLGSLTTMAQRNTGPDNAILLMSSSGAKGNSVNLTQIRGAVGQQTINGSRVAGTLPAFGLQDTSCERYGFIRSSYTTGLSPTEFFHHAMSGREGIVDTAVKTADTGYLGRRLAKGFESVRCHYGDSSVRNAFGEIIQFSYGNDGCDAMWLERFSLAAYFNETAAPNNLTVSYRDYVHSFVSRSSPVVFVPCDIDRLLLLARSKFEKKKYKDNFEQQGTDELVLELLGCLGGTGNHQTLNYQAAIALCLGFQKFSEYCPSLEARKWVLGQCLSRYERARVAAGEMVGIFAGQSIAQPSTQLTLNTFHFAGVLAYNVTLGLPRLKEITDASSSPSSPTMIIPLRVKDPGTIFPFLYRNLGYFVTRTDSDPDLLRLHLNFDRCVEANLSPEQLAQRITSTAVLSCSPANADEWYIDVAPVPSQNKLLLQGVMGLPEFEKIKGVAVHPISMVSRFSPFSISSYQEVIITMGSNFQDFFAYAKLYDASVDVNSAYTNHIHEVYTVLGIEAATALILSELRQVLSFDGTFVHDRHFQLIVDVMTQTGSIMPLSRHGLNKNMNTGILARASFEATVDQLLEGALRNEVDHLRGVSENIFMGLMPPMGTGVFDVISTCKSIRNGLVTVAPCSPRTPSTRISELDRIFNLVNLLVPFNVSSFCYDSMNFVSDKPAPMECVELSSRLNSFYPTRRSRGPYRPSSPIAYDSQATSHGINPLELLRDIHLHWNSI